MNEKDYADLYKICWEVPDNECYMGGHNCASCMYRRDHDQKFRYFENDYCLVSRKG